MDTVTITAADVNKLRLQTGAGMMDCKKALSEANGDFEKAIDFLRKKGQKVAANRVDRDAKEGIIIGKTTADGKRGVLIALNCETDFVAKNADFVQYAENLLNLAIEKNPKSTDEFKALPYNGITVSDSLFDQIGKIGEKIDLSRFETIEAPKVIVYNHPGNKLASMVGFNQGTAASLNETGKDIAMQIAAMNPVAIDKDDVDPSMLQREIEIGKDQARQEGKPEDMIEKIAMGKLNKFYKECTLNNQSFIKDEKKTILQLLNETEKGLKVTAFKRIQLGA
jgi:elongation factor Ts